MDTGAFASRSSSLAEWHMAVARAAHQGGVNVTVFISACPSISEWSVWLCPRLLATEESQRPDVDTFGVFAVFHIAWMDAENCVWSTRLYETAGTTVDYTSRIKILIKLNAT